MEKINLVSDTLSAHYIGEVLSFNPEDIVWYVEETNDVSPDYPTTVRFCLGDNEIFRVLK